MSQRLRGERGEAVTETVLLVPVLLLLIMLVIQFGLWYHAEHVVQAAAQEGARAARAEGATAEDGRARAEQFVTTTGGGSRQLNEIHSVGLLTTDATGNVIPRLARELPRVAS